MLTKLKNNATKLWSHLKSLTNTTANNKISLSPNTLNDFFTSVFKQAPSLNKNHLPTISTVFKNSFFFSPITTDELICTAMSLSNSISIGDDGIRPDIIKDNIALIAEQLKYIFNLSFRVSFQKHLSVQLSFLFIKVEITRILTIIDLSPFYQFLLN